MESDVDVRGNATSFEAVKIAFTQDKNGFVLKLSLHPSDAPEAVMMDALGTRYMVTLVRLADDNTPVPSSSEEEGKRAVALAGALCGDEKFQSWLAMSGDIDEPTELNASAWLRSYLGVTSRKELKIDRTARDKLYGLRDEFVRDLKAGKLI